MHALDQLGMMLEMARRSDEAIRRLEQSLAIALELRDLGARSVRTAPGHGPFSAGSPARARPHLERALEIAHQMGDRYLESVSAWAAAEMEDALGSDEGARAMRARELVLLACIGGNPHNEALRTHTSPISRGSPATTRQPPPRRPRRGALRLRHRSRVRRPDRGGARRGALG